MKEEHESEPRRRETPAEVIVRRAARQLVSPLNEQIGVLQAETIKLEAKMRRSAPPGRTDPALASATRMMLDTLTVHASAFEASVAEAPEAVRVHSRVADSRKVLRMLEQRLQEMLDGLDPPKTCG